MAVGSRLVIVPLGLQHWDGRQRRHGSIPVRERFWLDFGGIGWNHRRRCLELRDHYGLHLGHSKEIKRFLNCRKIFHPVLCSAYPREARIRFHRLGSRNRHFFTIANFDRAPDQGGLARPDFFQAAANG